LRLGLWDEFYIFDVRDFLLISHVGGRSVIAAIAFAAFDLGLGALAAVYRQRASNSVLRLGEFALLAADVPLFALSRLDLSTRHGLMPEE
jgi:hypothetical protein